MTLRRHLPAVFAALALAAPAAAAPRAHRVDAFQLGLQACSGAFGPCPATYFQNMVDDDVSIYLMYNTSVFPTLCRPGADDTARLETVYNPGDPDIQALIDYARSQGRTIAYGIDFAPDRTNRLGGATTFDPGTCADAVGVPLVPVNERKLGTVGANQVLLKEALKKEAVYVASVLKPRYFAFGVEVEGYLKDASADERAQFWAAFDEIKAAAVAAADAAGNPGMKVFAYYQYEAILNDDLWPILAPTRDHSDLYGFSSYPTGRVPLSAAFPAGTGASFPVDYYQPILDRFGPGKPVAFFELGQPRESTAHNPYAVPGAPAQDQADWMAAFVNAIQRLEVEFVSYTSAYDIAYSLIYGGNTFFDKMGLRSDPPDTAFPAWTAYVGSNRTTVPGGANETAIVYPNPFRPATGHAAVTIARAPAGARVRLFSVTGTLVRELRTNDSGVALWDGKNAAGQDVASGVYFAVIDGSDGDRLAVAVQR